jgi:hypothetical protein
MLFYNRTGPYFYGNPKGSSRMIAAIKEENMEIFHSLYGCLSYFHKKQVKLNNNPAQRQGAKFHHLFERLSQGGYL